MLNELALDTRAGLPDALRVLLKDYPRDSWSEDENFNDLVRFWLDRHLMFRRLLAAMSDETARMLNGDMDPMVFGQHLTRYGSMFAGELHGHHQIEDHHYFPALAQKDPRLSRGFEILDRDHHAMDAMLQGFAEAANRTLGGLKDRGKDAAAGFEDELGRVHRLLDRHLVDEEELVVPVILRHGAADIG